MEFKNYLNEKVENKIGNVGTIVAVNDNYITIMFNGKTSEFQIDAFEKGFLKFVNKELQNTINAEIELKRKEEERRNQERLAKIELARIAKEKELQELTLKEKIRKRQSKKENDKNIAYKATYCDGNGLWFRKPCSKQCMHQNIKSNRSWCSRSLCKDYLDGKVTEADILNRWNGSKDLCYESRILEDFSVSAGLDDKTYKPRKFVKLAPERLVVLTTVEPNDRGNERIIFGAFLVEEIISDAAGADKAISQKDYRIELTLEEARQIRFWDYYENRNSPDSVLWGQGLIRYLSDELSAKILYDMVEIIKKRNKADDTTEAISVLNKYLSIIGLTIEDIK